jgi:toxin ParE1/3/4
MKRYAVAPAATRDLDEIWTYIARNGSIAAAERVGASIQKAFALIAANPRMGRARPTLRVGLRRFVVENYLIYYRESRRGTVEIVRISHAARDERKLFRRS